MVTSKPPEKMQSIITLNPYYPKDNTLLPLIHIEIFRKFEKYHYCSCKHIDKFQNFQKWF